MYIIDAVSLGQSAAWAGDLHIKKEHRKTFYRRRVWTLENQELNRADYQKVYLSKMEGIRKGLPQNDEVE